MKCLNKNCNNIWHTKPSTIIGKQTGCPKCNKLQSSKKESGKNRFDKEMEKYYHFEVKDEYILSTHSLKIVCKKCGNILSKTPKEIYRRGLKCSCETESRYVIKVKDYFLKNNIQYENEYTKDLVKNDNGRLLKYDFYLKDLNILLEIDGQQHFDKSKFNGNYYYEQVKNDIIKNNNSKRLLIRISYSEFDNFDNILNWIVLNSTTIETKLMCFGVEYISSDMEIESNLCFKVEDIVLYPIEI